jgi:hypothetical protein
VQPADWLALLDFNSCCLTALMPPLLLLKFRRLWCSICCRPSDSSSSVCWRWRLQLLAVAAAANHLQARCYKLLHHAQTPLQQQ